MAARYKSRRSARPPGTGSSARRSLHRRLLCRHVLSFPSLSVVARPPAIDSRPAVTCPIACRPVHSASRPAPRPPTCSCSSRSCAASWWPRSSRRLSLPPMARSRSRTATAAAMALPSAVCYTPRPPPRVCSTDRGCSPGRHRPRHRLRQGDGGRHDRLPGRRSRRVWGDQSKRAVLFYCLISFRFIRFVLFASYFFVFCC